MTIDYPTSNSGESKIIKIRALIGTKTKSKQVERKKITVENCRFPTSLVDFPFEALASAVGGWDPDHVAEAQHMSCGICCAKGDFLMQETSPQYRDSQEIKPY